MEGGRPRSGDGTLLCPAQLPGALESVAANGLIGINSGEEEEGGEEESVGQGWKTTEEKVSSKHKRQASTITAQEKQSSPSEREAC